MSFLDGAGDMMSGSGIEGLLELVCPTNNVAHMISVAIRGHFFNDSCLNNILINKVVKKENNPSGLENIDCLEWAYNNCKEKLIDVSEVKKISANATT